MTCEKPLISIITVVKNCKHGFEKTVNSICSQTYKNLEYIVVDGGSCDGTLEVVKDCEECISRWVSESDGGISDAFNKGVSMSSGQWIAFLNAGDVYAHPSTLETVASYLDGEGVVSGVAKFGEKKLPKWKLRNYDPLHKKAFICHQAAFVRREIFDDVGRFDQDLLLRMDYDFWMRVLSKYELKFIDDIWVDYDADGVSGRSPLRFYYEEIKVNTRYFGFWSWLNLLSLSKCGVRCAAHLFRRMKTDSHLRSRRANAKSG